MVQLSLKKSTLNLNRALEQMTTGYRINSAKDDAAGYAVATRMGIDLSSYRVAQNNANLGLSLLNTAESSLDIVTTHLQRIRDLAEQAANGTYGQDSIAAIQAEIDARTEEIKRVMYSTEYNGIQLYGDGTPVSTGDFINVVKPLTEEEAIAQGYTIIKTADDLNAIRNNTSVGKYILMNDIDLSGYDWEPLNSIILDGNGYVIKNLTINRPTENYVGFIKSGGNIRNLGFENVNITGNNYVGAIVGELNNSIINCYVTGKIKGNNYVGGLTGGAKVSTAVRNSYSSANISGNHCVGGIVGSGSVRIDKSFSDGNISGVDYIGGLAGENAGGAHISNSYVMGTVSGTSYVGGVMGTTANNTFSDVYWNIETSGQTVGIGLDIVGTSSVVGVTTSELNELIKNGSLPRIAPEELKGGQIFNLQIGIDSSSNSVLTFDTTFSFDLDVNVSSTSGALSAINTIDEILKQVTAKQTEFGAVQNRLDSIIDSLDVSIENTTSSLSTIRDADIAKVSSDFIRAQILQQASAALLATANQSPSFALNLI